LSTRRSPAGVDRRAVLPAAAGLCLLAVSFCVVRGGLLDGASFVDLHLYRTFSARMLAGQIPYRDFFVEYQPGSIPTFVVPGLISQEHYQLVFRLEMAVLAGVALVAAVAAAASAGVSRRRLWLVAVGVGALPFALGPVALNGFDFWPAALAAIACSRSSLRARRSPRACWGSARRPRCSRSGCCRWCSSRRLGARAAPG
jgi:hypothetical protein